MLSLSNRFLKYPSCNLNNHPVNNHNLKDYIRKIENDLKNKRPLTINNINPNHCSLHVVSISILFFLAGYGLAFFFQRCKQI
jgi:hypothetical protein